MFESDIKKGLRKNMMAKNSPGKEQTSVDQNNSVYGELKLSEKLQIEIYAMKEERD
jgi:hypothetical protein